MSKVLQNAPREHSAMLSTFIKLPFVFKTFVLSIFEWPLKTGFTVSRKKDMQPKCIDVGVDDSSQSTMSREICLCLFRTKKMTGHGLTYLSTIFRSNHKSIIWHLLNRLFSG